jgi:hypothetical protein
MSRCSAQMQEFSAQIAPVCRKVVQFIYTTAPLHCGTSNWCSAGLLSCTGTTGFTGMRGRQK